MAISDRDARGDLSLPDWLAGLRTAGVDTVQLREKHLEDRALLDLARTARRHWPRPGLLLINGRADVALAADADGVHLPSDEVPVAALRERFKDRLLVGRSTHSPAEVREAAAQGADWVSFGPIFATPSKQGDGEPPGLDGLRRAVEAGTNLAVLALGGLFEDRLESVRHAGAAGIAGIRAFHDFDHLPALTHAWSTNPTETSDP